MAVDRCGRKLGISENTLMLVEHMIISHHGEPEFGAAVRPDVPRVREILSPDTLDAKIYEIEQACAGMFSPANSLPRQWALDTTASSITMTATTPISRLS